MTQLNPFTGSILQSPVVQQQQQSLRQAQVEHRQHLRRNSAASNDQFTHDVENTEEVNPIHDEERQHGSTRQQHEAPQPEDQVVLESATLEETTTEPATAKPVVTPLTVSHPDSAQARHIALDIKA